MLNSKFEDLKLFLKGKKILITTHDLVDIDGLASCLVLKFYLIDLLVPPMFIYFYQKSQNLQKSLFKNLQKNFLKLQSP